MKFIRKKTNKDGFALLFSVLVSSLLLTIGLSIFNIALKELAISTATKQSIHAFYAADSGRECAMYWEGSMATLLEGEAGDEKIINCGSFDDNQFPTVSRGLDRLTDTTTNTIVDVFLESNNTGNEPNFDLIVTKTWDPARSKIDTKIESRGYDTTGGDRVERAIEVNY